MSEARDHWFTFLLAIVIMMLGGIGAMQMHMNSQLWEKLDRVTNLMLTERDNLNKRVDCENARINGLAEKVAGVEAVLGKNGNGVEKK